MNVIVVSNTVDGIDAKIVAVDEVVLANGERVIRPQRSTILVVV